MIEGLQPHAKYKESGSRWLGAIPPYWKVLPLCRVASPKSECNRPDLELLSVYLHRGVIRYSESGDQVHKPSLNLSNYQVVNPGDFVLNNQQAWRGSVGVSNYQGIISPAYLIMRLSPSLSPSYANLLLRSPAMVAQYVVASRGVGDIQRNLYYPDLRGTLVPVPPPDEQAAIVRFLNHANRKIDGFIQAKRKLIALLEEQKQAIIHRAVTRGIDSPPLKPSGMPWLDCVPSHWSMHPNRSLFQIRKKIVGSRHREFQVLSLTKRGVIIRDMDAGGKYSNFWERSQEVRSGDMVFCFFDVDETPRSVGLSRVHGMISPDYTVMECPCEPIASFLELFYIAMDNHKMLKPLYTGLRKRISKPLFLAAKTPIPPNDELRTIVEYVKDKTKDLDQSSAIIHKKIMLMLEYRTRLTADVVTGKLDVRTAAAKLPVLSADSFLNPTSEESLEESDFEEIES